MLHKKLDNSTTNRRILLKLGRWLEGLIFYQSSTRNVLVLFLRGEKDCDPKLLGNSQIRLFVGFRFRVPLQWRDVCWTIPSVGLFYTRWGNFLANRNRNWIGIRGDITNTKLMMKMEWKIQNFQSPNYNLWSRRNGTKTTWGLDYHHLVELTLRGFGLNRLGSDFLLVFVDFCLLCVTTKCEYCETDNSTRKRS